MHCLRPEHGKAGGCWSIHGRDAMKIKCLHLAVMLAASAVNAVTFEQARPVWPEASDGLPNENVRFAASFEADGRPLVLKATGATQYKIRLDGETVGWGPARAPEGWARVSEIPQMGLALLDGSKPER